MCVCVFFLKVDIMEQLDSLIVWSRKKQIADYPSSSLTVEWLQSVRRAALDEELEDTQQQLEGDDQVVLHLQSPSCRSVNTSSLLS